MTNNEKDKQIRESHIDTLIKNDKANTRRNNILNNLYKDIEGMINRKTELSLDKFNQSIRMNYKYQERSWTSKTTLLTNNEKR